MITFEKLLRNSYQKNVVSLVEPPQMKCRLSATSKTQWSQNIISK